MSGPDVRTRIVMAAMELFWVKGYNSTSIADILSRTQLNAGSLYHVFPGKQEVLIAVLEADGLSALEFAALDSKVLGGQDPAHSTPSPESLA